MAKSYQELQQESYLGIGWAEDVYERTLLLDRQGDIAAVGGLYNLSNAIFRRLKTPLAWYPEYPWYGSRLNEMIGMGNSYENRELIATWIEQSLLFEERFVDGTLRISVEKNIADYRAVNINIRAEVVNYPDPAVFVYSYFLKTGTLLETGVS
ncbi:hypothetical protein A2Z67_06205 [Candidatus Woesebacteria bacterium RBG_13_36_22]|uniref:IraD/Gp25-like domain-containing protein n=1 Tax=Candidatus Woesebacteria bacterium RBG_13_36_22 TaxID=1802478 RepID=A0A1F7X0E0_9BACT|nr:MAG: hypothetical protein A2Z67_06205 [Candidatus Woesebacteria bacterium RBG_13_36_22]